MGMKTSSDGELIELDDDDDVSGYFPSPPTAKVPKVRSIHWFPYDRVRVVDADP